MAMPKSTPRRPGKPGQNRDSRDGVFGHLESQVSPLPRVGLYARVSTPHQHTIGMQLRLKPQVLRGRWRDPYTGNVHVAAQEIDIDHVVPLFYARERGANRWEPETQRRFANDSANLLPVGAMVNRSKGAAGPLEWLPPSEAFACEYLLRFARVADRYDLSLRPEEVAALEQLTAQKCD